jgi:hypothetical protein
MAAEALATQGLAVDLFDAMPSVGRKFLLAGKGGLNLTHAEAFETFVSRYAERAADTAAAAATMPARGRARLGCGPGCGDLRGHIGAGLSRGHEGRALVACLVAPAARARRASAHAPSLHRLG